MTTATLLSALRRAQDNMPGHLPFIGPLLGEGTSPPDANTPVDCLFYADAAGNIYSNRDKTGDPDDWLLVMSGSFLTDGEKILKVTA